MDDKQQNGRRKNEYLQFSRYCKCDYETVVQIISLSLPYIFWIIFLLFLYFASIKLFPLYQQHRDVGRDHSFNYSVNIQKQRREYLEFPIVTATLGLGEDASFICYSSHNLPIVEIAWYLDDMPLQYTWRHKRTFIKPECDEQLEINFIQESDYGVYTCYIQYLNLINIVSDDLMGINVNSPPVKHILKPRSPSNVIVHIPVGGIFVHTMTYRVYDDLLNSDYILVNNKSYYETCGVAYSGCSWFVSLFMKYLSAIHDFEMPIINIIEKIQNGEEFYNVIWGGSVFFMCVCPRAYGNITVRFLRSFYNFSSARSEFFPMPGSVTFTLIPRRSPFYTWGSEGVNRSVDSDTFISERWLDIKEDDIAVFNVVEIVLLIICTTFPAYVCFCIVRKIACWILVHVPWSIYYERHQVYIACADKDEPWTENVLEPYIKSFGHTTYIHNRDAACGGFEIPEINKCLDKCTKFMIVVSHNSLSSPLLEFQVQLLLDQVITKSISAFQVMVVSLQPVHCSVVNDLSRIRGMTKFNWSETIISGDSKKTKQSKKRHRKSADSQKDLDKLKSKLKKALYDWLHASSLIKDMFEKKMQRIPFYQSVFIWIVDSVLVYVACKYLTQYGNVFIMIVAVGILTVFVSILFSIARSSICFR